MANVITGDVTGQDRIDAALDGSLATASAGFTEVAASLSGVSETTHAMFRELADRTAALPVIATATASRIKSHLAEADKPQAFRNQNAAAWRQDAGELINQLREAANLSADRLEASLQSDLFPKPAADLATRQLKRQEAQLVVARAGGIINLIARVGQDAGVDGELLSDFGRALLSGEDFAALRAGATARLIHLDSGALTERQAAAQRALAAFHARKIRGLIATTFAVARQRLDR